MPKIIKPTKKNTSLLVLQYWECNDTDPESREGSPERDGG